jgi:hypothetical protein
MARLFTHEKERTIDIEHALKEALQARAHLPCLLFSDSPRDARAFARPQVIGSQSLP